VGKAEAEAGVTTEEVVITGAFQGLIAEVFEARLDRNADPDGGNLEAIRASAEEYCANLGRTLLHVFAGALADEPSFADERSNRLAFDGDISAISMPLRGARQITACLEKSLLNPKAFIGGPLAAALAVTLDEERQDGVLVIDIGAQSSGCVLFVDGIPLFLEILRHGGEDITAAIQKAFVLAPFEAERLKIRHGSVFDGLQADVDLPFAHGETGELVSKFALNQLIRPALKTLFTAVKERLKTCGYAWPKRGVVLTGGGSQIPGIEEFASQCLCSDARLGKTRSLGGFPSDPSSSALVGACFYVSRHQSEGEVSDPPGFASVGSGYASRISQWLRASF
jgi:cell division protein FtsA